jgi:hypothetical protein
MLDFGNANPGTLVCIDSLACISCKLFFWFASLFLVVYLFHKCNWNIGLIYGSSINILLFYYPRSN